jgi:hypothetical protein
VVRGGFVSAPGKYHFVAPDTVALRFNALFALQARVRIEGEEMAVKVLASGDDQVRVFRRVGPPTLQGEKP